ncbi:MAG: hypothetical protein HYS41_05660 [Candidatus Omnitrophica bacterium]|nr:hypothetical protein [Candidatus Omnitrophota bacterium]
MRCDTCQKEVPEVSRVVIYVGYNKLSAKAVYNCPDCFAQKERTKTYNQPDPKKEKP